MTERRCIAMGVGPKEAKHFYMYDIDRKDIDLARLMREAPDALMIATHRGFHILNAVELTSEYILGMKDLACPSNAVRFDPHDDLVLLRPASALCLKVAHIYEAVFDGRIVTQKYLPCGAPLKFGVYRAEKDGIKLHGEERTLAARTKTEERQLSQ